MTTNIYHPVKIIGGVAAILTLAEVFGEVSKDFYKYKVLAKPMKERKRRIKVDKLSIKEKEKIREMYKKELKGKFDSKWGETNKEYNSIDDILEMY
jgi:uncharacterized protein YhaN